MALSGVATNRTSIDLPVDVSQEIMAKTQQDSAVMRLARQIALPGRGTAINVITSDPEASWVGETASKPVSNPGLATKVMRAYKLAVIVPFSNEFRRDVASLYDALVSRLPRALAQKFDATVFGNGSKPGSDFDNFASVTAQSLASDVYAGLVIRILVADINSRCRNGYLTDIVKNRLHSGDCNLGRNYLNIAVSLIAFFGFSRNIAYDIYRLGIKNFLADIDIVEVHLEFGRIQSLTERIVKNNRCGCGNIARSSVNIHLNLGRLNFVDYRLRSFDVNTV